MRRRELLTAAGILALPGLLVVVDASTLLRAEESEKERGGSRSRRTNRGWTTERIMPKTPRLHSPARPAEASSTYRSARPAKE